MSEPKGKCQKCGKPYERLGTRFDKHVAACGGKAWVARVPRKRGKHGQGGPFVKHEDTSGHLGTLDQVIAFSKNRRLDLLRQKELVKEQITLLDNEIQHLDSTMDLLQSAKKE